MLWKNIRLISFHVSIVLLLISAHGFGQTDLKLVDLHASKVPNKHSRNIDDLVVYLTGPYQEEVEKIRAIYVWIGQNIRYDHRPLSPGEASYNHRAAQVFEQKRGVCTGFANLFRLMATKAGIQTEVISGYTKHNEEESSADDYPDHVWNAVFIKDQWYPLDVTWDGGIWRRLNDPDSPPIDKYFLVDVD